MTLGVFIGRFTSEDGSFDLNGSTLEAFWNVGAGTDLKGGTFTIGAAASVPEPGSLAIFGVAAAGFGFVNRRRRKKSD